MTKTEHKERIRPTVHERNELLAQIDVLMNLIKNKEERIRMLESQLDSFKKAHKPNRFISPRLLRMIKSANG